VAIVLPIVFGLVVVFALAIGLYLRHRRNQLRQHDGYSPADNRSEGTELQSVATPPPYNPSGGAFVQNPYASMPPQQMMTSGTPVGQSNMYMSMPPLMMSNNPYAPMQMVYTMPNGQSFASNQPVYIATNPVMFGGAPTGPEVRQ